MRVAFKLAGIVFCTVLIGACRKKVEMPDSESQKLFGTWNWVTTSGGCVPGERNPASEGYNRTIEFSNKGICKQYKNGDLESRLIYEVKKGATIYSANEGYILTFKKRGLVKYKEKAIPQSIEFHGQDTLVLRDETSEGYLTAYVRSK